MTAWSVSLLILSDAVISWGDCTWAWATLTVSGSGRAKPLAMICRGMIEMGLLE